MGTKCECPDCLEVQEHQRVLLAATEPVPEAVPPLQTFRCTACGSEDTETRPYYPDQMKCAACGEEGGLCAFCSLHQQEAAPPEADAALLERIVNEAADKIPWRRDKVGSRQASEEAIRWAIEAVLAERGEEHGHAE